MMPLKDMIIRVIEARASRRTAQLSCQLVRAKSEKREMILAELEFEQWLADCCRDCRIDRRIA